MEAITRWAMGRSGMGGVEHGVEVLTMSGIFLFVYLLNTWLAKRYLATIYHSMDPKTKIEFVIK